jgi:hypothetical protein
MMRIDPRRWTRRVRVWVTVAAIGCLAVTGVAVAVTVPQHGEAASSQFISRSGSTLMLAGKPFRFSGTNIYWGAYDPNARPAYTYPTTFRVGAALATAQGMGATVVRCQTCGISTGSPLSVEPSLGNFSQTALRQIDYFVAQAAKDNIRLVIPLTNNYNYYTGGYCTFTNWLKLSTPQTCPSPAAASAFYSNPAAIAAFEKYISVLLNHVNSYTGVANKLNPAIMAWETGNELPYGTGGAAQFTQWTSVISSYIKSIAPSQLVMDGSLTIDRGDLTLPTVDIQDVHPYPIDIGFVKSAAAQVSAAGQALVVGEYAWNNPSTTSGLAPFLAAVAATKTISGDIYWDLLPQNDFFGFVQAYDGYQLHFPGDTYDVQGTAKDPNPVRASVSDSAQVTMLRTHAFGMSGTPVPAYPVPQAPLMANVEHVASATAGTGNLLEWRGSPMAASYVVRSATAAGGPWTTVGTVAASGTELPYLVPGAGAGPNLWYTVTAVNPDGTAGAVSTPYQVKNLTLDDNLNDLTKVSTNTGGVVTDSSNPAGYFGDASRANYPAGPTVKSLVWHQAGLLDFEAVAYYGSGSAQRFNFEVSTDGKNWSGVPAANIQAAQIAGTSSANLLNFIYTIANVQQILPGANYVRVQRDAGATGTAELGEVRITYP